MVCSFVNKLLVSMKLQRTLHSWIPREDGVATSSHVRVPACEDLLYVAAHLAPRKSHNCEAIMSMFTFAAMCRIPGYIVVCGLRATSHTWLKALDHGIVRALIGRKGGDRPSSLHTRT
jgi:hypothetical protein